MNTDCSFKIGKSHLICEDYALNLKMGTRFGVVLSDGCSSSDFADVGARIWCNLVKQNLFHNRIQKRRISAENGEPYFTGDYPLLVDAINKKTLFDEADEIADRLHVSLDATLIFAIAQKDEIIVEMYGDGVIAVGEPNGEISVFSIDYSKNCPFYPSYMTLGGHNFSEWQRIKGNKKETNWYLLPEGADPYNPRPWVTQSINDYNADVFRIPIRNAKFVAIMSDGVKSFFKSVKTETSVSNVAVPWQEVVFELLSFKSFIGKFVERRVNKFLKKCQKEDIHHEDDISIGVIHLDGLQ